MKINHINYINEKESEGKLKQIYKHIRQNFGKIVEPFVLHSADVELIAAIWSVFYETVLVESFVKRSLKEAVATCVSEVNKCRYCVDAHSIMLFGTDEKLNFKISEIKDKKIIPETHAEKIIHWALNSVDFDAEVIKNPPFTINNATEIIGTVIIFNYINRMVTVFAGETPLPVNFLQKTVKKIALKLYFHKAILKTKHAGESLQFLPKTYKYNLSHSVEKNTEIELTMLYFQYLAYKNIEKLISKELKLLLEKTSKKLSFLKSGFGNEKLRDFLKPVNNEEEQIAEFCFLIMFEPYKIYRKHIDYLKQKFTDTEILYLASFCSFIISEKIGNELHRFVK